MAGSFGYEAGDKYDVSVACAERVILPEVRAAADDTVLLADGFSCRSQIGDLTERRPLHLAQVLALARRYGPEGPSTRRPEDAISSPRASTAQLLARGFVAATAAATATGIAGLGLSAARGRRRRSGCVLVERR